MLESMPGTKEGTKMLTKRGGERGKKKIGGWNLAFTEVPQERGEQTASAPNPCRKKGKKKSKKEGKAVFR